MRFRCSSLGKIMTNSRKKGELSKTAQSYVQKVLKERLFEVSTRVSSKYTDKGLIMEDEAIDLVALVKGFDAFDFVKNEEHFKNEYLTGTPDIIHGNTIRDIKCSWSVETYPLFDTDVPNKDYYWQLMGYMFLTGAEVAYLDYCLVDTPHYLIEREISAEAYRLGVEQIDKKVAEEIRANMTFNTHDPKHRVKTFTIERDEKAIETIINRVGECNLYADTLQA